MTAMIIGILADLEDSVTVCPGKVGQRMADDAVDPTVLELRKKHAIVNKGKPPPVNSTVGLGDHCACTRLLTMPTAHTTVHAR